MAKHQKHLIDFTPFGVSSVKTVRGHEGEPVVQGNLTLNGKKCGEWSGDFHGGMARIYVQDAAIKLLANWIRENWKFENADDKRKAHIKTLSDRALIDAFADDWYNYQCFMADLKAAFRKPNRIVVETWIPRTPDNPLAWEDRKIISYSIPYSHKNLKAIEDEIIASKRDYYIHNETMGQSLLSDEAADAIAEDERYRKLCKKGTLFLLTPESGGAPVCYTSKHPYSALVAEKLKATYGSRLVEIINLRYL